MTNRYPNLPNLSADEFNDLARIARGHRNKRDRMSEASITMARLVLLDGMSYKEAALTCGKPNSASARHAVVTLLRGVKPIEIVQPHTLFRPLDERSRNVVKQSENRRTLPSSAEAPNSGASKSVRYPGLPQLTTDEFDALASMARSREWRRSGNLMSLDSIEMARAVLLNGASYQEATEASGHVGFSPARKAVHALLAYLKKYEIDHPRAKPAIVSRIIRSA